MPRIKKNRLVQRAPSFAGFKPIGAQHSDSAPVMMSFEEYESLNLCDYELLTQAEAAAVMDVSRPTFTRIYESMRRKMAQAFIECRPIRFEIGNAEVAVWYRCKKCSITFLPTAGQPVKCPFCGNEAAEALQNNL